MNIIKTDIKLSLNTEYLLITVPGLFLIILISGGIKGFLNLFGWLRLFLGLPYVLLVPGYVLLAALFPRRDNLTGIVRLALSISLSVAVIPIIALVLNNLPWGIRLWPIVVSEGLFLIVFSSISWFRRSHLPENERFLLSVDLDVRGWWLSQDRVNRIVYIIMLGLLFIALSSAAAMILIPKPGEYFTEFYIVGPEGLIENYPREAVVGESLFVTIGLTNLERGDHNYRLEVWVTDPMESDLRQMIGEITSFTLPVGQTFEYPISWTMPWVGSDQKVEFFLVIDDQPEPYRQLHFWLDVVPKGE